MALSQNPDLRDSCCMCLSVASLSPVPLCLPPSDFLDNPYLTFHIHMISRKGFWGSFWFRSFSYIQKPEGSRSLGKTLLAFALLNFVVKDQICLLLQVSLELLLLHSCSL